MYRWLRNTHLFSGLFTFLFIIMYAVSSVQMADNSWFRLTPTVTTKRVAIAPEKGTDARAVARELMDRNLIGGEISEAKPTEAGLSFRVVRPGAVQDPALGQTLAHQPHRWTAAARAPFTATIAATS